MARIGINLAFIEARPLTGPGVYARELTEKLIALAHEWPDLAFHIYLQPSAAHHFSAAVQPFLRPIPNFPQRYARVAWEQLLLPLRTRRDRIDLLFSPPFVSPLWGSPRLVATIHDMYYAVIPEMLDPGQRRYWQAMMPLAARACDAIIAVSESTRRDVERFLPAARGKTVAILSASRYPRVHERLEPPPEAARGAYVLLVANATRNKAPGPLVAAIRSLRERGYPLRLVHVGQDTSGIMRELAAGDSTVELLGKVTDEHLQALYQHALCTVHPSRYEGFGLPVLEAQALGSPLIVSNRAALPEVAGEGAILYDPDDTAALTSAIARLFDSPEERERLIERGYANLARFSWDKTARETVDLFRRVLAGGFRQPSRSAIG